MDPEKNCIACLLYVPHKHFYNDLLASSRLQYLRSLQAAKGAKAYEKAEDPIYALENNLPIDFQHYLEHHISQPIMRIFEPMMNNPKDLLSGTIYTPQARLHVVLPSGMRSSNRGASILG